jgi:hypothetical protein
VVFYANGSINTVHFHGKTAHASMSDGKAIFQAEGTREGFLASLRRDILGHARNQTLRLASLAPPELRVSEALCQDGVAATYEWPGYVSINHKGTLFAFGTADDYWAGHGLEVGGETCEPFFSSQFASSSVEAEQISAIVEWIKECINRRDAK